MTAPEPNPTIPDEAVEAAARVMREKQGKSWDTLPEWNRNAHREHATTILAAAYPYFIGQYLASDEFRDGQRRIIKQAVAVERERIAAAIEAELNTSPPSLTRVTVARRSFARAARIARGAAS